MGKSKKKKNLHKDFQKVKLKVGKQLPKGLNETVATFKSRSIQVKEQLKVDRTDGEPTTRRKLSLSDLLSQCQHYSTTVKHEALTGIKELLLGHPELTHRNLAVVLDRCSELFMDKDPVVRQTVQKVLRLIFTQVSSNQIAPFFPSLSAHLCCAMTHINEDIQQDSLGVLDLCLENCPELVTASSNHIMPNFIEQISRQTQTSKGNTQGRSLLVNPSSRLSSQKWRNKVLARLQKFFRALLEQRHSGGQTTRHVATKTHHFAVSGTNNVQPFGASCQWSGDSGWLRLKHGNQQNSEDSKFGLKNFVEVLVPLLLQSWIEAGPSQLATDLPGNCLGAEAMNTLWNVVNILQLLLELLDQKDTHSDTSIQWFSERYFKELVQHFLPYFPYAMHEKPRHTKKGQGSKVKVQKEVVSQISVFTLNLSVCKVFSYFMEECISLGGWQGKILEYLCEGLPGCRLSEEQLAVTVGIVQKVLACTKDDDTVDSLLSVTFELFKSCTDVGSKETKLLLRFFGDFTFGNSVLVMQRKDVLKQWMASLPSLVWLLIGTSTVAIATEVASSLLHCLKSAGPLCEKNFISNLETLLFDNVFAVQDDRLNRLPKDLQKRLVGLLHWVPASHMDSAKYPLIAKFCRNPNVCQTVVYHVLDLITVKYQTATTPTGEGQSNLVELLSLMISLVTGEKSEDGSHQPSYCSYWTPEICTDRLQETAFHQRLYLLKIVPEMMRQCQKEHELAEAVVEVVKSYLTLAGKHKVNLFPAIGFLRLTTVLNKKSFENAVDSLATSTALNGVIGPLFGAVVNHLMAMESALVPTSGSVVLTADKSDLINGTAMDSSENGSSSKLTQVPSAGTNIPVGELNKDLTGTMSTEIHQALWEIVVEVVVTGHGLLPWYINKVSERILGGHLDMNILTFDLRGLTQLLQSQQVKKAKTHKQLLQTLVTGAESSVCDKLSDNTWHQLKYEISLL